MLARKEQERDWVGSAVRCLACAGRDAFTVNRYTCKCRCLVHFGRQRLSRKMTSRVGVAGHMVS
jgi:hypothetical protein